MQPYFQAARPAPRPWLCLAGCVRGCSSTQSFSAATSLWAPRPASSCCQCSTPSGGPARVLWRAAHRTAAERASGRCWASPNQEQQQRRQQQTAVPGEHMIPKARELVFQPRLGQSVCAPAMDIVCSVPARLP